MLASEGIREAYETGKGAVTVRGCAMIEEEAEGRGGTKRGPTRAAIAVTELPYQTNKAKWVEQLVHLVDCGTLTGVVLLLPSNLQFFLLPLDLTAIVEKGRCGCFYATLGSDPQIVGSGLSGCFRATI